MRLLRTSMFFRNLTYASMLWLGAVPIPAGAAAQTTEPMTLTSESPLEDYLLLAATASPGLQAAYERWMAALEEIAVARGWPDPRLSYTYYLQEVETALGPQEHALALSQLIPWFGKLSLKGDAAEQAALSSAQTFRLARLELWALVAAAYYEYAYLAQATEITQDNLDLLRFQETVANTKYRTDTARYADLLKAQVELGILEDRLRTLRDRRVPASARLNQALGRHSEATLPWPVPLADPGVIIPSDDDVLAAALRENPAVLRARHEIKKEQRLEDLARRNRFPDFNIGLTTILTGESELTAFENRGRDAWMGSVSINLPLWQGKYSSAIKQAAARSRAAEHALEDTRQRLDSRVQSALFEFRDARRKVDLYGNGLVPKAEQALQSAITAYQAGHATFLDFIDAERTLLMFELDLAQARADAGKHAVEIVTLMGTAPIEGMEDEGVME